MGKQPKSTTQNTFPPWLMSALQPLIGGATKNAGTLMNQGMNVLQGQPHGGPPAAPQVGPGGGKGIDMQALMQQIGGAGRTKGLR